MTREYVAWSLPLMGISDVSGQMCDRFFFFRVIHFSTQQLTHDWSHGGLWHDPLPLGEVAHGHPGPGVAPWDQSCTEAGRCVVLTRSCSSLHPFLMVPLTLELPRHYHSSIHILAVRDKMATLGGFLVGRMSVVVR